MRFKTWMQLEVQLSKDFEDDMHYWTTGDELGHVAFSVQGDTMHVDFLRNQEEFDPRKKGPPVNMLAILRELKQYLQMNPAITRITANVQNKEVRNWLLGLGARIVRPGNIAVMELPVAGIL